MMTPPPFDPDVAHALNTRTDIVTTLQAEQIDGLRAGIARPSEAEMTGDGAFTLTQHLVPVPDGHEVLAIVLRPRDVVGPLPVLYHVHGGGLVVGTPYEDLPALVPIAEQVGCAIVAVDYRLAPEDPYPAPLDDVYAVLSWVSEAGSGLGLDAERVVIGGVSAGGGLAAAATLLARDRGGPRLIGQLLACPMLDDRNDSLSAKQMAGIGAWDRTANRTGWDAYLGTDRADAPIYASPARAEDLSGLPPMFIDVGSAETFRDEVLAFASRFWACGGDGELHVWAGGAHGFDALVPDAPISRRAVAARVAWLERVMADETAGSRAHVVVERATRHPIEQSV
jgi:acetyl esterase/lipase